MKQIGTATKKPIPVKVFEFKGNKNIETQEGIAYEVDGETHYILEGVNGERGPIAKSIFDKTYTLMENDE